MILYHGSKIKFDKIDITKGAHNKDFGNGFYTTFVKSHAKSVANRFKGATYIYTLEIDEYVFKKYKYLEFTAADIAWMKFIRLNRRNNRKMHGYDIVKGPTADDSTSVVLNLLDQGVYGDPDKEGTLVRAAELLETENLPVQVYFGSQKVVDLIRIIRVEVIK